MSSKSPIFPMPQPQHFSDYGFDPQIDYFQVLEEARKHKRDHYYSSSTTTRSIDSIHFKLSKPISKDNHYHHSNYTKKKRWWRNALLFFRWKWAHNTHIHLSNNRSFHGNNNNNNNYGSCEDVHQARARAFRATTTSISGPVYITESLSGPTTPRRSSGRCSSGPLAGTLSPVESGDVASGIPYVSLRQLNMEQQHRVSASSTLPIYLVT